MNEKLNRIIQRLLAKTSGSELKWQNGADDGNYFTSFPEYSITLSSSPFSGGMTFTIVNKDGEILEHVYEQDLKPDTENLRLLYIEARRSARNVSEKLDEIISILG